MAGEDPGYCSWVREQPCSVRMHDPCDGPVVAHHAGNDRGLSQRAHDHTCIPFCNKHHVEWHGATGMFKRWKKGERRAWQDAKIALFRQRWAVERAKSQAP